MGKIITIVTGMGLLIALYVILKNGSNTTQVINALASGANSTIKTLQGN